MALTVVRIKKEKGFVKKQPAILQKSTIKEEDDDVYITQVVNSSPSMKRNNASGYEPALKAAKLSGKQISLQTIASAGTPITTFDGKVYNIASSGGGGKQQIIRTADGNTIRLMKPTIKLGASSPLASNKQYSIVQSNGAITTTPASATGRRPTIYIKTPAAPKKTIRSVTLELIEKSPHIHLGITTDRLSILKNVLCPMANISTAELYITLKKLRLNEDFALLAEYFEYSENEVHKIFTRTVVKMAKYMKFLIRWPDSKKYYDRHKNLPIAFRSKLSYVQSLIDCVETEVQRPPYPSIDSIDCNNYKFILTMSPSGVISYVSDAFVGNNDDLTIFNACDFQNVIPKYLSLVADPGKAIRRKRRPNGVDQANSEQQGSAEPHDSDSTTDSAEETEDDDSELRSERANTTSRTSHQTLNVVNSELTSRRVKNFSIPTLRVRESVCRSQIRHLVYCLREFKILQPYTVLEPILYQYINEILVVVSALTNLQR